LGYWTRQEPIFTFLRFIADAIISPYPIPGVPLEVLGGPLFQARGVPEKNKKNAKASASRAALDILVRKGTIQINEVKFFFGFSLKIFKFSAKLWWVQNVC